MNDRRQITLGIFAHVDAGKTTLSEAVLFRCGEIRRLGRVDHRDSFLDDNQIERNRGITVFSKQARFTLSDADGNETLVTMIDTPGHVDFTAETERAMSVIDYALLVVSGSEGVQAHTRTLYRMLRDRGIPVFIFVNKMDIAVRLRADITSELSNELEAGAADFTGYERRTDTFIDNVTLHSHTLSEAFLENGTLTDEEIAGAVSSGEIVPCIFGSALRLEGIDQLTDILGKYLRVPDRSSELSGRVYKISNAEDGERLTFIKINGGQLSARDRIVIRHRGGSDEEAKINQLRLYSGSKYVQADTVYAGDVCAVTGVSDALPGDGVGDEPPLESQAVQPFMKYIVTGPDDMDPYLVMKDLEKLAEEDPALSVRWESGTGEISIRLMGQVQLEVIGTIVHDRYGYDVTFGSGSVLYMETVAGQYEGMGHFEPLRHYAEVHLIVEPGEPGSGIVISSDTPEDELSRNWQRLIMTHLEEKEHLGVLTGSPITDIKITLAAGRAHDKHTSGGDFREATYRAVRHALMQARSDGKAVLLEPWLEYEMELPAASVGRAMMDIRQMGGTQDGLEQYGDSSRIRGLVPASEITGYQQVLTGYTSGLGRLSCTHHGYAPCHDQQAVIEAIGYDPDRDTDNPADSVFVSHGASDIVRWDEAAERMHIGSVLRKRASGISYHAGTEGARARRAATEEELRDIFERTYGADRKKAARGPRAKDYRADNTDKDPEKEARNLEIRARHERRTDKTPDKPPMIVVDGYNLIYQDQYLNELSQRDMGAARDQLLDRLCNFASYLGYEMIVVFDAYRVPYGTGSEEDHLGIRVIYTRENEPADIRIGLITDAVSGRRLYIVTSDSLVQQDAFLHGALRISSREFMESLSQVEEEIRTKLQPV